MASYVSHSYKGPMIEASKITTCKKCGCNNVIWLQSKAGKWYLVETKEHGGQGMVAYNVRDFHNCDAYLARKAANQAQRTADLDAWETEKAELEQTVAALKALENQDGTTSFWLEHMESELANHLVRNPILTKRIGNEE